MKRKKLRRLVLRTSSRKWWTRKSLLCQNSWPCTCLPIATFTIAMIWLTSWPPSSSSTPPPSSPSSTTDPHCSPCVNMAKRAIGVPAQLLSFSLFAKITTLSFITTDCHHHTVIRTYEQIRPPSPTKSIYGVKDKEPSWHEKLQTNCTCARAASNLCEFIV